MDKMFKALLCLVLLPVYVVASKTDDALAAALAQNKALALTNVALTKAIQQGNSAAAARSNSADQQRDAASAATTTNAVAAQQAVSDQKETAVRVEAKTDAAATSAAAANHNSEAAVATGDRNTMLIAMFGMLATIVPVWLRYKSDGRQLAAAAALAELAVTHQAEVVGKLNQQAADTQVLKTQTDGMTNKIAELAAAAGHSQGVLDERNDAGRTGD
jgi:hypothetical protein